MMYKRGIGPLNDLGDEMLFALAVIEAVFKTNGAEVVVTSTTDGEHMEGSKHYTGNAVDLRRRHLSLSQVEHIIQELRHHLGAMYDVVLEDTHIHVEYDPRG